MNQASPEEMEKLLQEWKHYLGQCEKMVREYEMEWYPKVDAEVEEEEIEEEEFQQENQVELQPQQQKERPRYVVKSKL